MRPSPNLQSEILGGRAPSDPYREQTKATRCFFLLTCAISSARVEDTRQRQRQRALLPAGPAACRPSGAAPSRAGRGSPCRAPAPRLRPAAAGPRGLLVNPCVNPWVSLCVCPVLLLPPKEASLFLWGDVSARGRLQLRLPTGPEPASDTRVTRTAAAAL